MRPGNETVLPFRGTVVLLFEVISCRKICEAFQFVCVHYECVCRFHKWWILARSLVARILPYSIHAQCFLWIVCMNNHLCYRSMEQLKGMKRVSCEWRASQIPCKGVRAQSPKTASPLMKEFIPGAIVMNTAFISRVFVRNWSAVMECRTWAIEPSLGRIDLLSRGLCFISCAVNKFDTLFALIMVIFP